MPNIDKIEYDVKISKDGLYHTGIDFNKYDVINLKNEQGYYGLKKKNNTEIEEYDVTAIQSDPFNWNVDNNQKKLIDGEDEQFKTSDVFINILKNGNVTTNLSQLVLEPKLFSSEYAKLISDKKNQYKVPYQNKFTPYSLTTSLDFLKGKNIDINPNKVEYFDDLMNSIYLDNGVVITIKDDMLYVKNYDNNVEYIYMDDNDKYVISKLKFNYKSNELIEFDYNKNGIIIKDLTKENESEQVISNIKSEKTIDNILYYKDDYNNESIYLSNGYLIRPTADGFKVMDRVEQLNEIVSNEIGNKGTKYRKWFYGNDQSTDWCAVFISWLYYHLPGDENFFSNIDNYGNRRLGQDGAGDIPRKSVINNIYDKCYGDWYESETKNSNTVPQVGDIILFNPKKNGISYSYPSSVHEKENWDKYVSSHVGYVYKVDDENVYTIEGNIGSIDTNLSSVGYKSYLRHDSNINGYFRPHYDK